MSDVAIRLAGLVRRFGKTIALDGLTLDVPTGRVLGLLGRNGAGKTTTLRILMGVLAPDSGTLELLGQRTARVSVAQKQQIGYVAQEQHFYPWMTARDLGTFVGGMYPTWDDARFRTLLRSLDVDPAKRSAELSGGTRTKLALALALAPRPPILLLDEPTAGLDPVARREFSDFVALDVRERGTTVVLSSHLVAEVEQVAHRVAVVQAGRIRIEGSPDVLKAGVRRLTGLAPNALPDGFERVRADVWRASPESWSALPPAAMIEELSLEDVFLAFARTDLSPGEAS